MGISKKGGPTRWLGPAPRQAKLIDVPAIIVNIFAVAINRTNINKKKGAINEMSMTRTHS